MNSIIKEQLSRVTSVKLEIHDDDTNIYIPLTKKIIPEALKKDQVYVIELKDYILEPDTNSVLASNWNAGKVPKHKVYKAEVIDILNNMVKFNGIPIVNNEELYSDNFFGWLPKDSFNVISKEE